MEIDTRFPTKLDTVSDAPEPFRSALVESFPAGTPVRLLVYAPSFPTGDDESPATVLAVTNSGWLVATETEEDSVTLEKSDFSATLFLELTSILLLGQLRISFAPLDGLHSIAIKFESVWDEFYREAIDLMLAGIDPVRPAAGGQNRKDAAIFQAWPMKFRNEAQRYWPKGQALLTATQWPSIFGGLPRQNAPAAALLITERELVLISEGQKSSAEPPPETGSVEESPDQENSSLAEPVGSVTSLETPMIPVMENADLDGGALPGDVSDFAEIVTFVPRVRLASFQVSHQDGLGVLTLQLQATHGSEKLEILFPVDDEKAVSKAMEQGLLGGSAT
jgi:hypothetical protein